MKKILILCSIGTLLAMDSLAAPAPKKTNVHHVSTKPAPKATHKAPIPAKFKIAKKALQKKQAQRLAAKKVPKGTKPSKPRFEKKKDVLGFVRAVPNKIMSYSKNAFLVNQYEQRVPVTLEKQPPAKGSRAKGFYFGSFYDDNQGIIQHVYLAGK